MRWWMFLLPTMALAQHKEGPPTMGTVTIQATHGTIWVGDAQLGSAPLEKLPLQPGDHTIKVCVGETCAEQAVKVELGKHSTLEFNDLPPAPKAEKRVVPADADAQFNAALTALSAGQTRVAIGHLEAAIKLQPALQSYALLCTVLMREKQNEKALKVCREAHGLAVSDADKAEYARRIAVIEQQLVPVEPKKP